MARRPEDREDLFREAVALVRRAEWDSGGEITLLGERANGWLSLYVGQDFALTFSADDELRRVFEHGVLYRAAAGRNLERLLPLRDDAATQIKVELLDESAKAALVAHWREKIAATAAALVAPEAMPRRTIGHAVAELVERLDGIGNRPIKVAPGMRIKRSGRD